MRAALVIAGLILFVAGLWIVFGHASYAQTDTLIQIGSAKLTATRDKTIPAWLGALGIVLGALLAAGGLRKKH